MPTLPFVEDVAPQYATAIPQLIYFVVSFAVVYLVGRIVVQPLFDRVLKRRNLDAHARKPLKTVLNIAVVFVAIAVAFGFAQYGNFLTSLATIAAAATLARGRRILHRVCHPRWRLARTTQEATPGDAGSGPTAHGNRPRISWALPTRSSATMYAAVRRSGASRAV